MNNIQIFVFRLVTDHLSIADVNSLILVNKVINKSLLQLRTHNRLPFYINLQTEDYVNSFIRQTQWQIKNIIIDTSFMNIDRITSILPQLTSVISISIIDDVVNPDIYEKLFTLEHLKSIRLRRCNNQILKQLASLNLKELHLDDQKAELDIEVINTFHNLESVSLRSQYNIYNAQFFKQQHDTLAELVLDCESFEEFDFTDLLRNLNHILLRKLSIRYFQDYCDQHILMIANFKNLQYLSINKAQNICQETYIKLVQDKPFRYINLNECENICDLVVNTLVENCYNTLTDIHLTWTNISSQSVYKILKYCNLIKNIDITGCKKIGSDWLPQNQKWFYLQKFNTTSCNLVDDNLLYKFKTITPLAKIINYYAEEIEIYH